jgi:hypothetical protein
MVRYGICQRYMLTASSLAFYILAYYFGIAASVGMPPLLVQRCNGTTAGLGYLEVNVICPCESPHWAMTSVRTVDPHGENGSNPLLTLTFSRQYRSITNKPPHHTTSTPPCSRQAKLLYVKCTRVNISL